MRRLQHEGRRYRLAVQGKHELGACGGCALLPLDCCTISGASCHLPAERRLHVWRETFFSIFRREYAREVEAAELGIILSDLSPGARPPDLSEAHAAVRYANAGKA